MDGLIEWSMVVEEEKEGAKTCNDVRLRVASNLEGGAELHCPVSLFSRKFWGKLGLNS